LQKSFCFAKKASFLAERLLFWQENFFFIRKTPILIKKLLFCRNASFQTGNRIFLKKNQQVEKKYSDNGFVKKQK
jgi:hypothetical protein